jgi:opine dehydrogenase
MLLSHAFLLRDASTSMPLDSIFTPPQEVTVRRRRRRITTRPSSHLASTESSSSPEEELTTATRRQIRVGIVGAGAIAFGTAALLSEGGHDPMLWSPSGAGTEELRRNPELSVDRNKHGSSQEGATREWTLTPRISTNAQDLVEQNEVLLIALPANGHKQVFDAIAPHVRKGQSIIISSHSSFGALYLAQRLRDHLGEEAVVPIIAWGTTVCTARRPSGASVRVNTVRQSVDLCTLPRSNSGTSSSLELCQCLFPQVETFRERDGLLAISLSNLNPQNHLGIALGNISRMEKGEAWYQSQHITPTIGRLLESLDRERLGIAEALQLETKTIFEHFSLSFHVPITSSISDMNQEIHKMGNDVYGPNVADSRYITEDIPFGLVPTIVLGQMVNRPATLHQSGVQLVSAMYGRDFVAENDLLPALHLEQYSLEELHEASTTGILNKHPTTSSAVTR